MNSEENSMFKIKIKFLEKVTPTMMKIADANMKLVQFFNENSKPKNVENELIFVENIKDKNMKITR